MSNASPQGSSISDGALRGAVILGTLGFALGFLGPIILTPEANQGPLLGIFITGPLGIVLGGIIGAVRAARMQRGGSTRGRNEMP